MFNNMTPVVKQLLIINVICYIMSQVVPNSYEHFSMYYFENPHFRIWQPITHMFMHSKESLLHIVFNMFALVSFGSVLEHFWGAKRFLIFYFVCGIGSALLHQGVAFYEIHSQIIELTNGAFTNSDISTLLQTDIVEGNTLVLKPMIENNLELFNKLNETNFDGNAFLGAVSNAYIPAVGASGAIYGLLVAFAFMFPNAELAMMFIPVPIKAKYFVPILVAFDVFSGISGSSILGGANVAHFAHVGGAITGFILMWIWKNKKFTHNRWN
ncbi:Rhomboid family protein [Flavobacterium indicum GPTSA100-9 = DSM 17447]|uniref:Rhomboid family protein n=1 Tax=Flavobacterium indicum (strain DSM 17447 / CIP 109464 / GPTSA100-9) TaxID=1094466 RepID=H8XVT1_FLAIG|nr:rhomboid family intramembrane serine protease [Flavobacterium indicum]CCG54045.1 Rhomboid family protein [Flavobacterium indicum GPTSA100-9 = DSM 17447]